MARYIVAKMKNHAQAQSNLVYLSEEFIGRFCAIEDFAFRVQRDPCLGKGTVSLSGLQRELLSVQENERIEIIPINIPERAIIPEITISLSPRKRDEHTKMVYETAVREVKEAIEGIPLTEGQRLHFLLSTEGDAEESNRKMLCIGRIEEVGIPKGSIIGIVGAETKVEITEHAGITMFGKGELKISSNFNFLELEIGGLKKEFGEMFRRAFIQRTYPPEFIQKMGITHVKGIMLYGPPGTGKTLIARKMSTLLNSAPPKIVNGPEILNKYVGQSEENIRKLFEDAESDYKKYGDRSSLHVIIFDEIDAICKSRGSSNGVGDQVVNQLLSKIDGVESLNNILVIGMTNRLDLIDDALLRPGRFEIHIEISLPDEEGRLEILKIHTSKMKQNCFIGGDVNMKAIAAATRNYTGAEITALVKSAASFALERSKVTKKEVMIDSEDFEKALKETVPSFGVSTLLSVPEPFYAYPSAQSVLLTGKKMVERLLGTKEKKSKTLSLLLSGKEGVGKTALAECIAKYSEIPFVRVVSPKNLVGLEENEKVNYIKKTFKDAYKSTESVVVLDDIEGLMDYVGIGPRFSNPVLQAIKIFSKSQDKFKVFVIGTAADAELMKESGILGSFDEHIQVPCITKEDARWFQGSVPSAPCKEGVTIREVIK